MFDLSWLQVRFWLARSHPEAGKFFIFALIQFLLGVGFGCGFLAANALLISRAGAQPLLYVYVGSSLFSLLLAALFYFLADRFPRKKLFILAMIGQGLLLLLLWTLVQSRPEALWPYFALRIYLYGVFILSTIQFWTLASDYFNHFEAQRGFPLLVAAGVLGDLVGGFLASALAESWGSIHLVLVWAWALMLAPLGALFLQNPREKSTLPALTVSRRIISAENPVSAAYPRGLTAMLLFFWTAYSLFSCGTDFLYNSRALKTLGQADELAAFFGKVTLFASAAVLFYQLFLATRLTQRWGTDRIIFGIPTLLLVGAGALYFFPGLIAAAVAESLIYFFVEFAAVALLQPVFRLFPQGSRGKIKVLAEGVGRPSGILVLLALGTVLPLLFPTLALESVLFFSAVAFLSFPWFFQRLYRNHLRALLHAPDPHLVSNAVQALAEPNKKEMAPELCRLLESASSLDLKKTIVLTLGKIQSRDAFQDIVRIFSVKDEALQMAVLESLGSYKNYEGILALFRLLKSEQNVSFQVRMNATRLLTKLVGKKMIPFLLENLDDADPRVRANALESIDLLKDRKAIGIILPFLADEHSRVRANAIIALGSFRRTRSRAERAAEALFHSDDFTTRLSGIYAIGEMGHRALAGDLLRLLHSPEKKLRMHAAVALAKMKVPDFRETFLWLLKDPDPEVAMETARHMLRFPTYSRSLLFESIASLKPEQRQLIMERMEHTSLDFSFERNLLWEQESEELGAPVVTPSSNPAQGLV